MKTHWSIILLLTPVLAQAAISKPWSVSLDEGKGKVEFEAIGQPSALVIRGKGSAPRGALKVDGKSVSGSILFDLDSLDTGIAMRNTHMKDKYLEVAKFRNAELVLQDLTLPETLERDGGKVENIPFKGLLNLHGVKAPVTGTAKIERNPGQIQVNARFEIKVSDFGIAIPSFAGITMAKEVQVAVQMDAPMRN